MNLAHTIAQTDRRVLVMDCDLRRPRLTLLVTDFPNLKNSGLSPLETDTEQLGVTELIADVLGVHLTNGNLNTYSVNDLIELTKLNKRSACLDLINEKIEASIFFEKGEMVDIHWKNRPIEDNILKKLFKENNINAEDSNLSLSYQKESLQELGSILNTIGGLGRKDLLKVLSIHSVGAIRAISSIENGHFSFSLYESKTFGQGKGAIFPSKNLEKLYSEFNLDGGRFKYLREAIDKAVLPTEIENLFILPSGYTPPNPSEIVSSKRMAFLIETLKNMYDFIIIDTPPVMPATDALLMAPIVDGTILVLKSGNTDRKIVQDVIEQFSAAKQPIIGIVLNQVDMKREGYYRYYQKYYSSYYGSN